MLTTALSAASTAHAALFAEASAQSHGKLGTVAIDDCGTVVPHTIPGKNPPPPPPPFLLAHFAGATLQTAFDGDEPGCGNVPIKWPFPPPPPPLPFVNDLSQSAAGM
jgi:hypothetical protein